MRPSPPPAKARATRDSDETDEGSGFACSNGGNGGGGRSGDGGGGGDRALGGAGPLFVWAPGSDGGSFPAGTGIRVDAGALVVLQIHYNSDAAGAPTRAAAHHPTTTAAVGAADVFHDPLVDAAKPIAVVAGPCTPAGDATLAFVTGGVIPQLHIFDLDTGALTTSNTPLPRLARLDATACAVDETGLASRRVVRASVDVSGIDLSFIVDIADGFADGNEPSLIGIDVATVAAGPAIATDFAGNVLLPLERDQGFAVGSFTSRTTAVQLDKVAVELDGITLPPHTIAAGHFSSADRDELAVLAVDVTDSPAGAALLFIAGPARDGQRITGVLPLDCRAVRDCRMLRADIDSDGIDELLVARTDRNGARHAEVFRFGP